MIHKPKRWAVIRETLANGGSVAAGFDDLPPEIRADILESEHRPSSDLGVIIAPLGEVPEHCEQCREVNLEDA